MDAATGRGRERVHLRLQGLVGAAQHDHGGLTRQPRQSLGQFGHRPHATAAAHDQHERTVEREPEASAHRLASGRDREPGIDRDAGDLDAFARHPETDKALGDHVIGDEVAIDIRVRPRRMRREVGDHDVQRHRQLALAANGVERLDGQEVGAHDRIGALAFDDAHQPAQRQPVQRLACRTRALVEAVLGPQRIERAPQPRRALGHGAVALRVTGAVETRREHQRVDVAHLSVGRQRMQRPRDRDRRALVTAAGGGMQDRDARPRALRQRLHRDHATAGRREQDLVIARQRAQPAPPPRTLGTEARAPVGRDPGQPQAAEPGHGDHVRW